MTEKSGQEQDLEGKGSAKGRQRLILGGAILLALTLCIWLFRSSVGWPVSSALEGESGAEISVYRQNLISTSSIVVDVHGVEPSDSAAGMTRKLLEAAEALQDSSFERIYLAHDGEEKFYLDGSYFQRLGRERAWQNPVYTIRTMPENVKNLDGTSAYGSWTGGLIGVLGQQMQDSNQFHHDWWIDDAISDL